MIIGAPIPKRPKQESLTTALVDPSTAFASAISPTQCSSNTGPPSEPTTSKVPRCAISRTGVSHGHVVDVRMKNLEQLRFIQQLLDVYQRNLKKQKCIILDTLRKL